MGLGKIVQENGFLLTGNKSAFIAIKQKTIKKLKS
jgi:hypothetical protein